MSMKRGGWCWVPGGYLGAADLVVGTSAGVVLAALLRGTLRSARRRVVAA